MISHDHESDPINHLWCSKIKFIFHMARFPLLIVLNKPRYLEIVLKAGGILELIIP